MLSARSSSSSLSTILSTRPDRSGSSPSSSEWFEAIVSLPLYAEDVSEEWEPLEHLWYRLGLGMLL